MGWEGREVLASPVTVYGWLVSVQVSILVISDRLAELQHLAVVFSRLSSHLQVRT